MDKNKCIIKSEGVGGLAVGYTKVKLMPKNYAKIVVISGVASKTIQDTVNELLEFALDNVQIENVEGKIIDLKL